MSTTMNIRTDRCYGCKEMGEYPLYYGDCFAPPSGPYLYRTAAVPRCDRCKEKSERQHLDKCTVRVVLTPIAMEWPNAVAVFRALGLVKPEPKYDARDNCHAD